MAHPAPPVPPDQQSDKIVGEHAPPDRHAEVKRDPAGGTAGVNTAEQGAAGNLRQNLSHQANVQDR